MTPPTSIDSGKLATHGVTSPTTPDNDAQPLQPSGPPTARRLEGSVPLSPRRASLESGAQRVPAESSTPPRRQSLPSLLASSSTERPATPAPISAGSVTPPLRSSTPEVAPSTTQPTDVSASVPPHATQLAEQMRGSRERLSSEVASLPRASSVSSQPSTPTATPTATSYQPHDVESLQLAHAPRQASSAAFFAMQNARHFGPVAAVRMVVQGSIAPELARAVAANPQVAAGVQAGVLAWSLCRRILSQLHTESAPQVANRSFAGHSLDVTNNLPRRSWQAVQSLGIAGGDVAALSLTVLSMARPELKPVAQAAAAIQVRAHLVSQLREFFRPTVNTVHVGNSDPSVPQPPEGRNLRSQDITPMMRLTFGAAAGAIEFGAQMLGQTVLGGRAAWDAQRGLAVAVGLIAGVANMLTSSVEDHMVDNASARRMQQTDPSHVTHIHLESRNPLTPAELGRQAERVDARVFNMMIPAMLAMGVMQALKPAMHEAGTPQGGQYAVQATVNALSAGLLLGSLLALTVKSYQLNDGVRSHRARQP